MTSSQKIAGPLLVLGAGSWGTALAIHLAQNGQEVQLWTHNPAQAALLVQERRNSRYLPDAPFPASLAPIAEIGESYEGILVAVPLKAIRETVKRVTDKVALSSIAWASKGIESGTQKFIHQILGELVPNNCSMAVISGPSFAKEVALGLPTAVTVASQDGDLASAWVARLHGKRFRAYQSSDIKGVEICGAVKNVLAIAAGVADGLHYGANSRAALITRGLAEMTRFGIAHGGQRETFMGLAGLGDLVLTCTDDQSRNRRVGLALGRGATLAEALVSVGQVAEGVPSAYEVRALARESAVDMPITEQVVRLLNGECQPEVAVQALLDREPKQEFG